MSETDFHDYWVNIHAKNFASKIKQIRRYMICTRVDCAGANVPPVWSGCAEIWLSNEQEQLESLQSDEFLNGARIDEPKWAAFWNTLVLDTEDKWMLEIPRKVNRDGIKLVGLIKRRAGMPVAKFREIWFDSLAVAEKVLASKGYRHVQARLAEISVPQYLCSTVMKEHWNTLDHRP